jgi:ribonuclease HII
VRVLGIDEAGRGCVLGDLVIAAFLADDPDDDALRSAGAADSKRVPAARRCTATSTLGQLGTVGIRRVSARQIDAANLNDLEECAIVELIREARPDVVKIDALGHPATLPALRKRLQAQLPRRLRPAWVIEPKADHNHPVVGAASIFAKTLRDELLDGFRPHYGDFGSGYPSDPKTRAWLSDWARSGREWPEFVRRRWATVSELAQGSLFGPPASGSPGPDPGEFT